LGLSTERTNEEKNLPLHLFYLALSHLAMSIFKAIFVYVAEG